MARPVRHPKTGIFQFRRRVPDALRAVVGKVEEKISLGTRDPGEAKILHARVAVEVEARWQQLAKGVQTLTHKQAEAIAGSIYRDMIAEHEDNPDRLPLLPLQMDRISLGKPGVKEIVYLGTNPEKSKVVFERMSANHNKRFVDDWLSNKGLLLDAESRRRLHSAVDRAIWQAREHLHRMAQGDYRPDPDADRFPPIETVTQTSKKKRGLGNAPTAIFEAYAKERVLSPSSYKKWKPIIELVETEHPDIGDITREWVIDWKDRLIEKGFSQRHVKESYIAALSAVCQWAVDNGKLETNPASRIKIRIPKKQKTRPAGYTDAEARQVLAAALQPAPDNISETYKAARRWVPWICAYTGARVREIAQLRKEDVKTEDGILACCRFFGHEVKLT